ncbi:MAG: hypothetical protein AXW17_13710 [Colwellia sp. Phe_37]|nr:MAG: hypothetical protein AXW17_13710 [Colwellia sp. Phe_37]|tara:strand:+ start:13386 stop:13862 length:477 start_codon:yes stop_codon:yes gene_type:complete
MAKWLTITLIVCAGLLIILLGLGYLLSENEKATTRLKNQLEQEAQLQQQKLEQQRNLSHYNHSDVIEIPLPSDDKSVMKNFEKTLINNLTCVTIAQCQVLTVKFKNIDCRLASNIIGASLLKKIATKDIAIDQCPTINSAAQLACQQNICTLISASHE